MSGLARTLVPPLLEEQGGATLDQRVDELLQVVEVVGTASSVDGQLDVGRGHPAHAVTADPAANKHVGGKKGKVAQVSASCSKTMLVVQMWGMGCAPCFLVLEEDVACRAH